MLKTWVAHLISLLKEILKSSKNVDSNNESTVLLFEALSLVILI